MWNMILQDRLNGVSLEIWLRPPFRHGSRCMPPRPSPSSPSGLLQSDAFVTLYSTAYVSSTLSKPFDHFLSPSHTWRLWTGVRRGHPCPHLLSRPTWPPKVSTKHPPRRLAHQVINRGEARAPNGAARSRRSELEQTLWEKKVVPFVGSRFSAAGAALLPQEELFRFTSNDPTEAGFDLTLHQKKRNFYISDRKKPVASC